MSMATYNRPPFHRARLAIAVIGQTMLLLFCAATAYAYIWLADTLINAPESTERCFTTATTETDYCRSQRYWK